MTVAERITITLPNDLYERLQTVKDKLNVSGLCQTTIERAVTIEEIKLKDIAVMDKVVERLRLEKQEANQEWKETGLSHGLEDAQELSYDDSEQLKRGNFRGQP
jgi:predicted CopG family antitoxin